MFSEEATVNRTRLLDWSKRLGDFSIGAAILAVVVMMVVPLTPWLIDLLITVSLGCAVLLLALSLFIAKPLSFTVFPTLLLVATLFRLALNISSTRLILIQADAGRVIAAFGGYIVGGDILIGAVIFGILAMVLFLVITKGAERVAEVAARFSLDALPGMQLAIDSDLRLGAVSQAEAASRRAELDEQSRYFGALDGAMKFVRGDAVAGLVIIAVNIAGGILVGTLRHGLTIAQAVNTYGRLTVGDGLVSMIPALLISTAAGLLVTRVGEGGREFRLGEQVRRQTLAEPRALAVAATLLIALAFVRGLPPWPFLALGALFAAISANRFLAERRKPEGALPSEENLSRFGSTATRVEMGSGLFEEVTGILPAGATWRTVAARTAETLRNNYGLPVSTVPFGENTTLGDRELALRIRGGISETASVPSGAAWCPNTFDSLKQVGVTSLTSAGGAGHWISLDDVALLTAAGVTVSPLWPAVGDIANLWLCRSVKRLIGVDETQVLVDRIARERPVLVRETVPKRIDLPTLSGLLGILVEERIHLDLVPDVLEAVSRIPANGDVAALAEQVRIGLSSPITAALRSSDEVLRVMLLDTTLTAVLESGLITSKQGVSLALSADDIATLVDSLKTAEEASNTSILVTAAHLRRPLAALLRAELPRFCVLKTEEIDPMTKTEVVMEISI